jgi:hypothetical protein
VNILTQALPSAVAIDGQEYDLNTDFRACLRVILAFEDEGLTGYEKQMILLANLYPQPPHDIAKALELGLRFLDGGKESVEGEIDASPRLYSFAKDAGYIFSAFRQTHGIDLETAALHWWAFLALFMDLGENTTFCQLVSLRKRVWTGKASKDERAAAHEIGEVFEVPQPDTRTGEEKEREAAFMRQLEGGD